MNNGKCGCSQGAGTELTPELRERIQARIHQLKSQVHREPLPQSDGRQGEAVTLAQLRIQIPGENGPMNVL